MANGSERKKRSVTLVGIELTTFHFICTRSTTRPLPRPHFIPHTIMYLYPIIIRSDISSGLFNFNPLLAEFLVRKPPLTLLYTSMHEVYAPVLIARGCESIQV